MVVSIPIGFAIRRLEHLIVFSLIYIGHKTNVGIIRNKINLNLLSKFHCVHYLFLLVQCEPTNGKIWML